jgi:hypothetical protein
MHRGHVAIEVPNSNELRPGSATGPCPTGRTELSYAVPNPASQGLGPSTILDRDGKVLQAGARRTVWKVANWALPADQLTRAG